MAVKNNWEHLAGCDWAQLLQFQPRFSNKCDWSKLDGEDWAYLLARQPQFADMCDWEKLSGHHWFWLLRKHPEFANRCDWSKLDGGDWINLIAARPEFIDRQINTDPHSPAEARVNAALPQIDAWYKAFNVKKSDKLFVPKNKRAQIW